MPEHEANVDILIHYILPFFVISSAFIVFHELGHYVTAKLFGINGAGGRPRLPAARLGLHLAGTIYSINVLPLGGFVRPARRRRPERSRTASAAQKAWKRIIVLVSGAVMNFILPIFLFALVFMIPRNVAKGPVVIDVVEAGSPAAAAGISDGDTIISINGHDVKNTEDAGRLIRLNMGRTLTFEVSHTDFGGETSIIDAQVEARWAPPSGQGPTGIRIHDRVTGSAVCQGTSPPSQCYDREHFDVFTAIGKGWTLNLAVAGACPQPGHRHVQGRLRAFGLGPRRDRPGHGRSRQQEGWVTLLQLAALLSLNLGSSTSCRCRCWTAAASSSS